MENLEIRRAAAGAGVKHWQIADKLGIAETTFCRRLRRDLPDEEKQKILAAIAELSQGGVNRGNARSAVSDDS